MLRARKLISGRPAGLEAILATIAEQVEPGDAVLPFAHSDVIDALLQPAKRATPSPSVLALAASPLAYAAGVAAGAYLGNSQRCTVLLLDTSKPESNWPVLLGHTQSERLPLIIVCPEPRASTGATLNWASLNRVSSKLRFPVLTVDGADAVAMYRAMQESILRARHNDGPSLLWCLMPGKSDRQFPKGTPLERLESYMSARNVPLPGSRSVVSKRAGSKSVTTH